MLDVKKRISLLQPLQGRSHQIKQLLTPDQKQFLRQWLQVQALQAWESSDDHFRDLFELE
jgi:Spy/CpxP family protein refolding chaperone